LTRFVPWAKVSHDSDEVTLRCPPHGQQGYPYAVQVDVTYRLDAASGLHVTVTATNMSCPPTAGNRSTTGSSRPAPPRT
jgi:galactose mutarotase-like enzyme